MLGRIESVVDAKGRTTSFVYDKVGRLTEVHDAENGTVVYSYDESGNRIGITDPNNHTSIYEYDELNRLFRKTEAEGNVTLYEYDEVGNLKKLTKPNGTIIEYTYDALDRLETIKYPDQSTVNFTYDFNGNRTGMADSLGSHTYVYDELNRMTSYEGPYGNVVSYGYDANGNRISQGYPGSKSVNYTYDALNRLTDVTDWLTNQTHYTYDSASRLVTTTLPNGTSATYGYDNANRLTSLSNLQAGASVISSYAYVLDAVGNQLSEDRNEPEMPIMTPGTDAFSYDLENRQIAINGATNTFDNNGNQTQKGSDTYVFDFEDRLVQTNRSGAVTDYGYDGLGDRHFRSTNTGATRFVLDINTDLTNVIAETDGSNNVTAYYVYGLGLISRIDPAGNAQYHHFDSRGSTVALTDQSGQVTDSYAYGPFGELLGQFGGSQNEFRFLGKHGIIDEGNDLLYVRARYYDPAVGRFVNKDIKEGDDRDGQSFNRYVYGSDNPIIMLDISGFTSKDTNKTNYTLSGPTNTGIFVNNLLNSVVSPLSSNSFTQSLYSGLITTGIAKSTEVALRSATIYVNRRVLSETIPEVLYGMTTSVDTAAPIAGIVVSVGFEFHKNSGRGLNWEEQAARGIFKAVPSAIGSAVTVGLTGVAGPVGTGLGILISAGLDSSSDYVYENGIKRIADPIGGWLYEKGVYNPDKKFLGLF